MKYRAFFVSIFLTFSILNGAERSDGLTFYHSFESADMKADFSAGANQPKINKAKLVEGISGKGLQVGSDAQNLFNVQFPVKGNIELNEGSISFWMKPVNYKGSTPGWIFLLDAAEPSNQGFRFYKYKSGGGFFWFTAGRRNHTERKTDIQNVYIRAPKWEQGQWHHVVISWRAGGQTFIGKEGRQRIYVDGKLSQERNLADKFIPENLSRLFTVGPSCRWGGTAVTQTVIDELKIYKRELLADEVKAEYFRFFAPEASANNTISAAQVKKKPVIDGGLTAWQGVSQYNHFYNNRKQWTDDLKGTTYQIGYDDDNLYIRIREPLNGRKRLMKQKGRDGELYFDDCWEVYVGKEINDKYCHYIFNGSGDVYDGIGRTGVWNGNSRNKSTVKNGIFTIDIAIPAKDLGLDKFKTGQVLNFSIAKTYVNENGSRDFYNINLLGKRFHDYKKFSRLKLAPPAAEIVSDIKLADTVIQTAGKFPAGTNAHLNCNGKTSSTTALSEKGGKIQLMRADIPLQYELNLKSKNDFDITLPFNIVPRVLVNFEMNPDTGDMTISLFPASADIEKMLDKCSLELKFIDRKGKVNASKKTVFAKKITLAPQEQPSASGILQLSFSKNRKEVMRTSTEYYHINYAAWKDYDGGMDDNDVPTPWTPVAFSNGILECISRQYDFSKRAMPDRLLQDGKNILRDKAALKAVIGSRIFDLSDLQLKPVYTSKGKYVLKGSKKINSCQVDVELEFEFDGFTIFKFQIDRKNTAIDQLYLEFPMRKEYSVLKMVPFLNEKGVERDDVGFVKNAQYWPFNPGIWVGNDERGLTWYSESDEFFYLKKRNHAIALTKNNAGEATLRINMIDHNDRKMAQQLKYVFGFQVTPVKPFPEPEDWMEYGFVSAPNNRIFISGWNNRIDKNYQGMPGNDGCLFAEEYNRSNLEWVKKLTTDGAQWKRPLLAIRYLYPNMCPVTVPEFSVFRNHWAVQPSDVWNTDGPEVVPSARVSPASQSWANFYCYRFDRYFATSTENGMYQDFSHPIKDMNPLYGAGYVRDGKRYPTYCIYKFREIQKRLYRIAKKYETPHRRIFFIGHSGGTFMLPHGNFWQMTNDGEYFGAVTNPQKPYLDFFDEARWRTEFNGRQFGLLCNFIPIKGKDQKYTEEIMAMVVPGGTTWMNYSMIHYPTQRRVFNAYKQFGGYGGIEKFLPYWNNSDYLTVSNKDIKATVMVRGKNALLLIGNWNKQQINAIFTFKNLKVEKIIDCDSNRAVKMQKNSFSAPIAGKNFKIFLLNLK